MPVTLAGGNVWLLADGGLDNFLDEIRDRIDDEARLRGEVKVSDVRRVAFDLLKANYDFSDPEAAGLLMTEDHQALTNAVSLALFDTTEDHQTRTRWAASALLANGSDTASVPVRHRANVLHHIVSTGRAIPIEKFTDAAIAAPIHRRNRDIAKAQVEARAAREAADLAASQSQA